MPYYTPVRSLSPRCTLANDAVGVAGNVVVTKTGSVLTVTGMTGGTISVAATGSIQFAGSVNPAPGDTVTINDGAHPAKIFEITNGTPGGGNIAVAIAEDPYDTLTSLVAAINAAASFGVTATVVNSDTGLVTVVPLNQTIFPTGNDKDLKMQITLIVEKWKRFYSPLPYHQIKKAVTPSTDLNVPAGEDGKTKYDPLYMEAIPAASTTVKEPHRSGDLAASDPELFFDPIATNFQVVRESKDKELKKWGFDQARELILRAPLGLLDEKAVLITAGDKVVWNNIPYKIFQYGFDTYWKNTNAPLYVALNCGNNRSGS